MSDRNYIEIKHLVLHELADVLKNDDIVGAFKKLEDDTMDKSLFYNFLQEILEINPLDYFRRVPAGFFTGVDVDNVIIPDSVSEIEPQAFKNSLVKNVEIKSTKVKTIPQECFIGSKNLNEVFLSTSVNYLGQDAFINCNSKFKVFVPIESIKRKDYFGFYVPWDKDEEEQEKVIKFMQEHLKKLEPKSK